MIELLEDRRLFSSVFAAAGAAAEADTRLVDVVDATSVLTLTERPAHLDGDKLPPPDPGQMPALHSSWLPGWLGGVIHNETSNPLLIYSSDHGWATLPPGESTSGLEDWDFADHPTQGWVKVFDTQGLILRDDGVLRSGSGIHWTPGPGGWTPGTPPPTVPPYQPGL